MYFILGGFWYFVFFGGIGLFHLNNQIYVCRVGFFVFHYYGLMCIGSVVLFPALFLMLVMYVFPLTLFVLCQFFRYLSILLSFERTSSEFHWFPLLLFCFQFHLFLLSVFLLSACFGCRSLFFLGGSLDNSFQAFPLFLMYIHLVP